MTFAAGDAGIGPIFLTDVKKKCRVRSTRRFDVRRNIAGRPFIYGLTFQLVGLGEGIESDPITRGLRTNLCPGIGILIVSVALLIGDRLARSSANERAKEAELQNLERAVGEGKVEG